MTHPRAMGLFLMGLAIVSLAGNTYDDALPAEVFLAGLALGPLGLLIYMRGSRAATQAAEIRTKRALQPRIRNDRAEAYATQQALNPVSTRSAPPRAEATPDRPTVRGALELADHDPQAGGASDESAEDPFAEVAAFDEVAFDVTEDVSFPVEIQEAGRVAEQLERLQRLLREGIITEAEFDVAKAKLLA